MARIRTIKPEFWTDGQIVECSSNARLLFIGTWTFADDLGNLDRSSRQLKMQIFPGDNIDCEPLIQELLVHGLLVEYSSNDKLFLHIPTFKKHQRIDRPGPARCPKFDESMIIRREFVDDSSNGRRAFAPVVDMDMDKEGSKPKPSRASAQKLNGSFSVFWESYPKKKSKGAAEKAWIKIKPDDQLSEQIIAAVKRATTSADWTKDSGQFIPHPATWLNAKGWEDEITTSSSDWTPPLMPAGPPQ